MNTAENTPHTINAQSLRLLATTVAAEKRRQAAEKELQDILSDCTAAAENGRTSTKLHRNRLDWILDSNVERLQNVHGLTVSIDESTANTLGGYITYTISW